MKQALVNGRWNLWMPDGIADHDIITGDYSAHRGWEFARFESMQRHLHYGDILFDIGTEHGWIAAILAREFVGAENMVLFEPCPEMWINIEKTWRYNGLEMPRACWNGFVGEASINPGDAPPAINDWPAGIDYDAPEVTGMPYRYIGRELGHGQRPVPTTTVDRFAMDWDIWPDALNIDVEGAELFVLRGAKDHLDGAGFLRNVFVSVHPDLMMKEYGHTPEDIFAFMAERGHGRWKHELLGVDHETHYRFWRS